MKKKKLTSLSLGLAIAWLLSAGTTCNAANPAAVYSAKETEAFKALAKEAMAALDAGKNTEASAKLTELETAWDAKEKALKPKDPATWTLIDEALDKAISALRTGKTNLPKGKAALEDLIKKLEQATKS